MADAPAETPTRTTLRRPYWSLARVVGLIVVADVIIASLSPFENWEAATSLSARLHGFVDLAQIAQEPWQSLAHVGGFLLLGAGLFAFSRRTPTRRRIARCLLTALCICTAIETYQVLMPSPHSGEIDDWVVNVLGSFVGVVAASLLRGAGAAVGRWYGRHERTVLAAALPVLMAAWIAMLLAPSDLPVPLASWNRPYPLLIGNERTGDRPWLGEIRSLAFYDHALTPDEISSRFTSSRLLLEGEHREAMGFLTGWDFTDGATSGLRPQGRLDVPPLAIAQPDATTWLPDGGLLIKRATTIETAAPPQALINAIVAAGRFSVEVVFRPANLVQSGPARIVSISTDPYMRFFMIGQIANGLEVRVRNTVSGLNGIYPALVVRQPVLDDGLQHAIVTYDGRRTRLYVKGRAQPFSVEYKTPGAVWGLGHSGASQFTGAFLIAVPVTVALGGLLAWSSRFQRIVVTAFLTYMFIEVGWLIRLVVTAYHPSWLIALLTICLAVVALAILDARCRPAG